MNISSQLLLYMINVKSQEDVTRPGGGESHMEWTGMLVVSLTGVNFGFCCRLGCSGLVNGCTRKNNKTEKFKISDEHPPSTPLRARR